jgi:hypothetical protein
MHVCSAACKPGVCPAIYTGPVDRVLARAIHDLTDNDYQGRISYKAGGGWRRLRPENYPELNRIIDGRRIAVAA